MPSAEGMTTRSTTAGPIVLSTASGHGNSQGKFCSIIYIDHGGIVAICFTHTYSSLTMHAVYSLKNK